MKKLRKLLVMTLIVMLSIKTLRGGSATWNLNPGSGDWNTATNWTPAIVPNGPASTATFDISNTTGVSLSTNTEVSGIVFNPGASAFTVTATPTFLFFTISGVGIKNNSDSVQSFIAPNAGGSTSGIVFTNSATAGTLTEFVTGGGSTIQFRNTSTAGDGAFTNNSGSVSGANGGQTQFLDTSTGGNATINNNGGAVSGAFGGQTNFFNTSSAGTGTFTNNGSAVSAVPGALTGGGTQFFDSANAGTGTFTTNGGAISGHSEGYMQFKDNSTAGNGIFTNNASTVSGASGGFTNFFQSSTAGNGIFTNNGSTVIGASGGFTGFFETSTAGSGTFTANGSAVSGASGRGFIQFNDTSNAGNGIFTGNGGAVGGASGCTVEFNGTSTAGNGTFTINGGAVSGAGGGAIFFQEDSMGGTARVEVFGNGSLDITAHNPPGLTIGSIEGSGVVLLGANNLTVGSNNLNTTFSGTIQDGGANGSFTKVGGGTLTFEGGAGNDHIADTVTLLIASGSVINLNYTGTPDTVRALIVNGVVQTPGVYGSAASGAPHQLPEFAGTGEIQVTKAPIPTPTPTPPVITSPLTATGTVGLPFVYQFVATGATSLAVSSPPPGLTFDPALSAIVGNPSKTGTFQVGLSATNSIGTSSATLVITIQPFPTSGPVIISGTAATGRPGLPFSFHVITTGGSPAARLSTSTLPSGLTVDPVSGLISGTVTSDESSAVTLTVTDGNFTNTTTLQLTFTSDPAVPVIISPDQAALTPGVPFLYTIVAPSSADPSTDPTIFTLIGMLPSGLGFDAATGTISGTYTGLLGGNEGGHTRKPEQSGGILLGNVQLFGTNSHGTSSFPLYLLLAPSGAVNISTRLQVETGNNVLIGGFIIQGDAPAAVLIRALGPSTGIPGALDDPTLELRDGSGSLVRSNDNWRDNQEQLIINTTIPPTDDRESAIVAGLDAGAYTAIVAGKNGGTGIGLVEVYDLGTASHNVSINARLANIATRGFADTGNNVMIGGFIVRQAPDTSTSVIVRAIGPSLTQFGITDALADPTLELHDGNGALLIANNDWQDDPAQAAQLTTAGLAPTNQLESGIAMALPPGPYTAIVRGVGGTTGVAVVEAYDLN